ncbi:MAG: hypothetical protein P4L34_14010 [Paludibacter sp.]|nr:hypothetical protein [Paludibacter sp.]
MEVKIAAKGGNLKPTGRKYKIIVVTDKGTVETGWTTNTKVSVKLPE